jgi:hypothetical protein
MGKKDELEFKLSSKQKGNILEKRFIELVSLGSNGKISCYTPDSDDDGIDVILNLKSEFKPLFIQVKSRFNINSNGTYSQDIGTNTFKEHSSFYICFFYYDLKQFDVAKIWLVPSIDFKKKAVVLNPTDYAQKLRFAASPKDSSNDQWSEYRVKKEDLGEKLLEIMNK